MKAFFCENCGRLNILPSYLMSIEVDGIELCLSCFEKLNVDPELHTISYFTFNNLPENHRNHIINQLRKEAEARSNNDNELDHN